MPTNEHPAKKTITKKSFEKMLEPVGTGVWVDKKYVLNECPFCMESLSFQFEGAIGVWKCVSCKEFGTSFAELEHKLDIRFVPIEEKIEDPSTPEGLIVISEYVQPKDIMTIDSGMPELDKILGGFSEGSLTILSGKQSEGKSICAGQIALNAIEKGHGVCFYSGELACGAFSRWIHSQAAGPDFCTGYEDRYGKVRYEADKGIVSTINMWLGKKLLLYDNSISGSSETQSIISKFKEARKYYGSELFIVDNLMTVRQNAAGSDSNMLAQSRFVGDLIDLAQQHRSHVILVAHPRKSEEGDFNDRIAGIGDITRRASNVMFIERLKAEEHEKMLRSGEIVSPETTGILHVSKNRVHGETGDIELTYDKRSRRLIPSLDPQVIKYGWEDLM